MRTLSETRFHMVMGIAMAGSLFLDPAVKSLLPTWDPPRVGLVTLVLGLIWIGAFAAYRARQYTDAQRVVEDRLERLQRRIEALEDERRPTQRW